MFEYLIKFKLIKIHLSTKTETEFIHYENMKIFYFLLTVYLTLIWKKLQILYL